MVTLVIATRNAHKVGEIRAILRENYRYLTLEDWPQAQETATPNAKRRAATITRLGFLLV